MENEKTISAKTQRLADTYMGINDEGRNILDMVIQELYKTHGDPEEIKKITDIAFVEPMKGINSKGTN